MSRYDGLVFQHLNRRNGLPHNSIHHLLQDRRGDIWITTDGGGVVRYRPQHTPPPVRITDVTADRRYGPVPELRLPSTQGIILFEFFGLSFRTHRDQMAYVYRLVGYDDAWRQTRQTRVQYTDLPVGDYVFEVKAVDRDLNYSEEPATVEVTVHPPYERIGLWSALGIVFALVVWQTARVVNRGRRLQEAYQAQSATNRVLREHTHALEEANQHLQSMDRLKSDFVANVSHELRTPLTSIKGSVDNMLDGITGTLSERQSRYLHRVKNNTDRLGRLINDLLDLARIEAGHLQIQPVSLSVGKIGGDVVETLKPLALEKNIALELEDEAAQETVRADPDRVYQILLNLVNNALKFTPAGGWTLKWHRKETLCARRCGIRERAYRRIRWRRSSRSFTRWVERQPNAAAPAWVCPLPNAWWSCTAGGSGSTARWARAAPFLSPCLWPIEEVPMAEAKILIADDEEDILEIVADRLEFYGFEVQTARDGVECLEAIDRQVPDLLLLDIRMPRLDGLEVLARLQQTQPELPVVVISASTDRQVAEDTLSRGAVDYLLKPFEPAELQEKVFGALKKEIP